MSRKINLLDYLPLFLQMFKELQAIMTSENPEFQFVSDEGDVVLDNTFILHCNEDGISRFEKLMGIYPLPGDTLEVRQQKVLIRWNDTIPYTMKAFLSKIATLQGNDNIQIVFDKDTYTLHVTTHLEKQGQQDDLAYLFETVVPCNIVVVSKNILNCNATGELNAAIGISNAGIQFITNDIDETFHVEIDGGFGGGISHSDVNFVTNDISEKLTAPLPLTIPNAIVNTEIISIKS